MCRHVHIKRRYNCFSFSHKAKDCKNKQACPKCTGEHKGS